MDMKSLKSRSMLSAAPFIFALSSALALAASCGKKESSDEASDESATSGGGNAGVKTNAGNELNLSGQLLAAPSAALALAENARGVILYTLDGTGRVAAAPKEISVDAEGRFKAPISRLSSDAQKFAKILKADGTADKALAKQLFPEHAADIDAMSAAELGKQLKADIEEGKQGGSFRYLLVSFEKSGDAVKEAASFQFIGMPTAAGNLSVFPADLMKGDTDLGKITGGKKDEATAELKAVDTLNLSAAALEELAGASQTLKVLKNHWMNRSTNAAEVTPWFGFISDNFASANNAFAPAGNLKYMGGGFYIAARKIGATFAEVCPRHPAGTLNEDFSATPAKKVEWIPPADIVTGQGTFGPSTPYDNLGGTYRRSSQYNETSCSGENLYTRAKSDSSIDFQLGMGGQFRGEPPKGNWKLEVADKVVGQWDLSAARPLDDNKKPIIYIPSFKVVTVGGIAKEIHAKFSFYDKAKGAYREVTDTKALESLVHSIGFDVSIENAGEGELSGDQHVPVGGKSDTGATATFSSGLVKVVLGSRMEATYGCEDGESEKCLSRLGMSYLIGQVSYRLELRKSSEWLE